MLKFVDVSRLNFRSEPKVTGSNRIGVLHLGQAVDVQEKAGGNFVKATTEFDGTNVMGFVSEKFLRDQVSEEREALVHQAITEWKRFRFGLGKEHHDPFFKFVGEMWKAIGLNLDGKDRDVPWSAAAISFMVRNAGETLPGSKYSKFRFAAAPSRFVHDSIHKRTAGDADTPFWGFDLHERRPRLGDIVCRGRAGSDVDFEHASRHEAFKSHCAIIVSIKEDDDVVVAMSGNVQHSVRRTEYELTPEGFLDDTKSVFAILVNQHE